MPQTTIARGNELYDYLIQPTTVVWSATTLATVSATEVTTTIQGLNAGDFVSVVYNPPSGTAITGVNGMPYGISIENARVTANNTLAVLFSNSTAGTLTLPTGPFFINVVRPEAPNNLPTSAG